MPEKYVYVSSLSSAYKYDWDRNTGAEYLGGDAYNYMIEASLKAGYFNAVVTTKVIKETGGLVLLFASAFFLFFSLYSLQNCLNTDKMLSAISKKTDNDYQGFVLQHLQQIEENTTPKKKKPEKETSDPTQYMDL